MLSRDEVSQCQELQMGQCQQCALKPQDDFCPYVWCMGEIKMGPCDEFVTFEKLVGGQLGELREQLLQFKRDYIKAKCAAEGYRQKGTGPVQKPKGRNIELEDENDT